VSNPHNSPWAQGDQADQPRPQPTSGLELPPDDHPSSNYSNPVLDRPRPVQQVGRPDSDGSEPGGWSEPQTFQALQPADERSAPVQFGQRLPYGYAAAPQPEHPNATLVLVLGIVGLFTNFMLLPFVSPIAWYLGAKARREMARHPGVYSDSGKLTAGVTLGVIGTVFALLGVAFIVLLILLAIGIS
jgi:hypothetical protein